MDAYASAHYTLHIQPQEPTPAQLHRSEASRPAARHRSERKLVHPLERERVERLLSQRDLMHLWLLR